MNYFKTGYFSGTNSQIAVLEDITVTETEFEYKVIDWHRHEDPYFSFVLTGNCYESDRKKAYYCPPGSLLFHNAQEAHYNVKSGEVSLGVQVEINPRWYKRFEVDLESLPSSTQVLHPSVRLHFYNIYKEARLDETTANLTVDALLLEIFELIKGVESASAAGRPGWVDKIDEMLHENFDQPLSLLEISAELGVHWAHLSRDFPRYFHCNFSQYLRKIKVERSLALLRKRSVPMADIANMCGFSDQSHFIRCVKRYTGVTPRDFRRILA
jgi:AraC family transcriptional regulator